MNQVCEQVRPWPVLWIVSLAVCLLPQLPLATAQAGDAKDTKAYARFANHFSMVYSRDGKLRHSIAEMQETDLPAITAFNTSNSRIKEAQRVYRMILPIYSMAREFDKKGKVTPEDIIRFIKDSPAMVKAGWNNDTAQQANFLAQELVNGMKRQANTQAAAGLYFPALGIQVRAWEQLIPVCESNAGAPSDKQKIVFSIFQRASPSNPLNLRMKNISDVDLHNVTLHINSNLAVSDMDGARKHYIFLSTWKAAETIECPPYLVNSLVKLPTASIKTAECMKYSLWCDELRQAGMLDLVFGRPAQFKEGPGAIHMLNRAKK